MLIGASGVGSVAAVVFRLPLVFSFVVLLLEGELYMLDGELLELGVALED